MLCDFVDANREAILARTRGSVRLPALSDASLVGPSRHGLPVFLIQLGEALTKAASHDAADHAQLKETAGQHGRDLFDQGLSPAQVVHDYGDVCQAITSLAVEQKARIAAGEFRTLNLCLDDAIAGAVTTFMARRERVVVEERAERLGGLAHDLRNLLDAARVSFAGMKHDAVATTGHDSHVLERSLVGLQMLIERSLVEVRLDAGIERLERLPLWEVVEGVSVSAPVVAWSRSRTLTVSSIDRTIHVDADRQILSAAVASLVQYALEVTRADTTVVLQAFVADGRALIEVEAPSGSGPDPMGLELCLKAIKALRGELHCRNLPGRGCVFTIDLPVSAT